MHGLNHIGMIVTNVHSYFKTAKVDLRGDSTIRVKTYTFL